jgi:hypothetical protein
MLVDVELRGIWNGKSFVESARLDVSKNVQEQQRDIVRVAAQKVAPELALTPADNERALDFATRLGFTKLDCRYENQGRLVLVDVLDPSKADY